MPRLSSNIETFRFKGGPRIPRASSHAVQGTDFGTYFFWRGAWRFTVMDGFYIDAEFGGLDSIDPSHHVGHNIDKLKQE